MIWRQCFVSEPLPVSSRRAAHSPLSPLAFGHSVAPILLGFNEHRDELLSDSRVVIKDLSPRTSPTDFIARSHRMMFGPEVSIRARSGTPVLLHTEMVRPMGRFELELPLAGEFRTRVHDHLLHGHAAESAVAFPLTGRLTECSSVSMLVVSVDNDRLQRTAEAMFPHRAGVRGPLDLTRPRLMPLAVGALNFRAMFQRICAWLDEGAQTPAVLRLMGIDDSICRIMVLMLLAPELPELLDRQPDSVVGRPKSNLDLVVDYIKANLSRPIRLSDLEVLSGLGARALRHSFQKRFGCSPMNWVRQQRLDLARARLVTPMPGASVTDISLEAGFTRPGDFAGAYRRRFGETPSATLASARRRRSH